MRLGLIKMIMNGWSICENKLVNEGDLYKKSMNESINL